MALQLLYSKCGEACETRISMDPQTAAQVYGFNSIGILAASVFFYSKMEKRGLNRMQLTQHTISYGAVIVTFFIMLSANDLHTRKQYWTATKFGSLINTYLNIGGAFYNITVQAGKEN